VVTTDSCKIGPFGSVHRRPHDPSLPTHACASVYVPLIHLSEGQSARVILGPQLGPSLF
jgi:hypothetical protein